MAIVVLGSGLVAQSLQSLSSENDIVVFAQGVSNSQEISRSSFDREKSTLRSALHHYSTHKFIYFSSTLVDHPMVNTPYALHKLSMEAILKDLHPNHLIIRLPQLVGPTKSPTLVASLRSMVLSGAVISIQSRARRRLLCTSDLARIVQLLLRRHTVPSIIDLAPKFSVSPLQIVEFIGNYYGISNISMEYSDIGYADIVDLSYLETLCSPNDPLFMSDYWISVLTRNLPLFN